MQKMPKKNNNIKFSPPSILNTSFWERFNLNLEVFEVFTRVPLVVTHGHLWSFVVTRVLLVIAVGHSW